MTTADELSRLLAAERAVRPPEHGLERGLPRLLSDVARHVTPLPISTTGPLQPGLSLVSKWLILGFVVGLTGAGVASQWGAPVAAAARSPQARETPAVVQAAVEQPPLIVPQPPLPVVDGQPQARAARVASASLVPSAPVAATFDEELRLISHARSELERGRVQPAAAWLSEHAQRFPQGVFTLEREALQVLVSCDEHRQLALAQAFAARHPSSPMVERLLRACGPVEAAPRSSGDF